MLKLIHSNCGGTIKPIPANDEVYCSHCFAWIHDILEISDIDVADKTNG